MQTSGLRTLLPFAAAAPMAALNDGRGRKRSKADLEHGLRMLRLQRALPPFAAQAKSRGWRIDSSCTKRQSILEKAGLYLWRKRKVVAKVDFRHEFRMADDMTILSWWG